MIFVQLDFQHFMQLVELFVRMDLLVMIAMMCGFSLSEEGIATGTCFSIKSTATRVCEGLLFGTGTAQQVICYALDKCRCTVPEIHVKTTAFCLFFLKLQRLFQSLLLFCLQSCCYFPFPSYFLGRTCFLFINELIENTFQIQPPNIIFTFRDFH